MSQVDTYQFGKDNGRRDAGIYGAHHQARYHLDGREDDYARGYKAGYEEYLEFVISIHKRVRKKSNASK